MEEDDELQNSEEQNGQLDRTIKRFEEMRRNKEQYFFDVDALVKIIEHYTDTLQYDKALDVMLYAHSMHPQTVTLKLKEAHLYALMGKEQKALSLLEEVEHINPFDIDVHLIRGNIYNSLEQYPRAIACFKKALEMADEQRDDIYLSLAITYQNMADFNKAVDYYMLCLRENNANEVAMEEAIISFEFSRRLDDAIVFFTELIDDNPYAYMLWYYLGEVYCKLGQFEKALDAYDYCLLIKDDFAPAHLDMAQAFSMLERFQDAIDRYRIAFEYCQPDAFIYYNLGECHEQLQQFEEARTYYKKAVKLSPEMAQAWYGIGVTFEEEERWYEAMHYVKKAIEIDDQNGDYWLAYGDCEYRLNNHESAEESYKKVIDFDPENADGWIAYSDLLGELNRPLEAVEILNSSILFHNENGEINYRLVCYLYAAGFIQEAYQQLEIALEKDPENFNIMFDVTPILENDTQIQKLIEQKNK